MIIGLSGPGLGLLVPFEHSLKLVLLILLLAAATLGAGEVEPEGFLLQPFHSLLRMPGFNQSGDDNEKPNILTHVYWSTGSADGRNTTDSKKI